MLQNRQVHQSGGENASHFHSAPPLQRTPNLLVTWFGILSAGLTLTGVTPPQASGAEGSPEAVELTTSDGVTLSVAFYPAQGDPLATVLLVHDIGGGHAAIRELAGSLQQAGCAVAVPNLRTLGASGGGRRGGGGPTRNELRMIAGTGGGAIRSQARIRGDLETVRNWLKEREGEGEVDLKRFCVIGSGLGGTLAACWTAADWGWQPNTRGPQGQEVTGLILISPVWADKGVSINTALGARAVVNRQPVKPVLELLPVMIIAGEDDSQAERLFKKFQAARPDNWYQRLADGTKTKSDSGRKDNSGPVVFVQIDSTLRADKLATLPSGAATPQQFCGWFIRDMLSQ